MARLNAETIAKLVRGERWGNLALVACAVVLAAFAVCFPIAQAMNLAALRLATLVAAPVLMAAAAAVAAFCNLQFGGGIDRAIASYVREVFVENAALMHPERDSLTFSLSLEGTLFTVRVNNFKEKIVFDFSAFGKLSAMRKLTVYSAVETRLSDTFCKLVLERGAKYSSVSYRECGDRKKSKEITIIRNGQPDKKAAKSYYKNRTKQK